MTAVAANQWAQTVRQQLGLGRLLPLGGPEEGCWIAERAAVGVLRTAGSLPGVGTGSLRLTLADPEGAPEPVVPAPPSALPPGPLRIEAECSATAGRPLPATADALRTALLRAATDRLGLVVTAVDVRITELLDGPVAYGTEGAGAPGRAGSGARSGGVPSEDDRLARAALAVPGVTRPAPTLGGSGRTVREEAGHVLVQVTVAADRRTVDVARAVRHTVGAAAAPGTTVAVLVNAVDEP